MYVDRHLFCGRINQRQPTDVSEMFSGGHECLVTMATPASLRKASSFQINTVAI